MIKTISFTKDHMDLEIYGLKTRFTLEDIYELKNTIKAFQHDFNKPKTKEQFTIDQLIKLSESCDHGIRMLAFAKLKERLQ